MKVKNVEAKSSSVVRLFIFWRSVKKLRILTYFKLSFSFGCLLSRLAHIPVFVRFRVRHRISMIDVALTCGCDCAAGPEYLDKVC
jgi:hypothetical protein